MGKATKHPTWRSKVVGHKLIAADQLVANPLNYRRHPLRQREALRAAINEIGFIRSVTVNVRTGNLIDGHERVWQALQQEPIPELDVEEIDLSEEEERKALATLDPIGEMARVDDQALKSLLADTPFASKDLAVLVHGDDGHTVEDAANGASEADAGIIKEMELAPFEHYDYLIVLARDVHIWNRLCELLDIGKTKVPATQKIGLGRAIDGAVLLKRLEVV